MFLPIQGGNIVLLNEMSDEDLIFLIRANSQAAEKAFYKRYSDYSLHLANKYYYIFKKNSGITLEELYAIAFSKTHEAVLRFDEIDKTFYAYWRTMVKNAIYDYVRTNSYEAGGKIFAGLSLDHKRYYDNEAIMLSDVVGEDEKENEIMKFLEPYIKGKKKLLTSNEQKVAELLLIKQYSIKEITEELHFTRNKTNYLIRNMKNKIQKIIKENYL